MKQTMIAILIILGIMNSVFASEVQLAPSQQIQKAKIHSQNLATNWDAQLVRANRSAYATIRPWDYRDSRSDTPQSLNRILQKMQNWSVSGAYRNVSAVNSLKVPSGFTDGTARSIIQGTISHLQQQVGFAKQNNGGQEMVNRAIGEVQARIIKIKTPAPIKGTSRRGGGGGGGGGGGKIGCGNPEIMRGASSVSCRAFSIF